jgi:hypothetical protein
MSHFTKIKTKLYNLEILKKSLNDLSLKTELESTEVRGYNNQKHIAELVIKQPNNHDIGFTWNGTEYELVTDLMFWAQPYSVDKFLNQVNQRYAYNSIVQMSEREGFQLAQSKNPQDGSVRLLLRKFN